MSEGTRALTVVALLLGAAPLAAQGPSAATLRAEARQLRTEIDSISRADRARAPVLDRVSVPGGWSALVSPELATTAPAELAAAMTELSDTFGVSFFPDTVTIEVIVHTSAYHSLSVQVGAGASFAWDVGLPLRAGAIREGAVGAGLSWMQMRGDSGLRRWIGSQPFGFGNGDFLLRARMELGTMTAPSVTACRRGDLAGCRGALGLLPGDSGALTRGARVSLFRFAFGHRPDVAALAHFYADSAQPLAERLGALAGRSPDQLLHDWRDAVLAEGNARSVDTASALMGALVLGALALAGFRRRSV